MSPSTSTTAPDEERGAGLPTIKTLENFAVWFQLHDNTMTNEAIARHLGVENFDADFIDGRPSSVFYTDGYVAGIRVSDDTVATFHVFQAIRERMKDIADVIDLKRQAELSQAIKLDWTIDPETGRSNSSPAFALLCKAIERTIRNGAGDLIDGRADTVAGLIAAQLAHDHGMAPRSANVTGFKEDGTDGVLHGMCEWNGRVYRLTAVPLSS